VGRACGKYGDMRKAYKILYAKPEENLGDLGMDGKKVLKWTLKKEGVRVWAGFKWFRIGPSGKLL
jgi:hypothetical protein